MANISARNLNDEVAAQIKVRAAQNGRSMEAEARAIFTASVTDRSDESNIALAYHERFTELGGVELEIPTRADMPRLPDLLEE